jgi:hypothetical protein
MNSNGFRPHAASLRSLFRTLYLKKPALILPKTTLGFKKNKSFLGLESVGAPPAILSPTHYS